MKKCRRDERLAKADQWPTNSLGIIHSSASLPYAIFRMMFGFVMINFLDSDALVNIAKYLEPEDVAHLKLSSRYINQKLNIKDVAVWIPYLRRLYAIAPHLSFPALRDEQNPRRHQAAFMQDFEEVYQKQCKEIAHFQSLSLGTIIYPNNDERYHQLELPAELNARLLTIQPSRTLASLEEVNSLLNEINAYIIRRDCLSQRGDIDNCLYLRSRGLTRFVDSLFDDEELKSVWPKFQMMSLMNNKLTHLPDGIARCTSLRQLSVSKNQLRHLPAWIGSFAELEFLGCWGNQLTELPKTIGNLRKLDTLACDNNKLQSLPLELVQCLNLSALSAHGNNIRFVPELFRAQFGTVTCDNLLARQNISLAQRVSDKASNLLGSVLTPIRAYLPCCKARKLSDTNKRKRDDEPDNDANKDARITMTLKRNRNG